MTADATGVLLTAPDRRAAGPAPAPDVDDYLPLVTYLVQEAVFAAGWGADEPALLAAAESALASALVAGGDRGGAPSAGEVTRRIRAALAQVRPGSGVPSGAGALMALGEGLVEVLASNEGFAGLPAGALESALGHLAPADAELLRATYLEERTVGELAESSGQSPATLLARRSAALRALGERLAATVAGAVPVPPAGASRPPVRGY